MQTEFEFVLPRGYMDDEGQVHRQGTMRLATAYDEIFPLRDPRVQRNPGYLVIILLARVITNLGQVNNVNPRVIENLFSADLAYLQDFYRQINEHGHTRLVVQCPHCQNELEVEVEHATGEA